MHHIDCPHFFFFNYTTTTQIYTLSLHDALPISACSSGFEKSWASRIRSTASHPSIGRSAWRASTSARNRRARRNPWRRDRKSTRLNSSHLGISYAVFCLKKKKKQDNKTQLGTSQ